MKTYQYQQTKPTRDNIIQHIYLGCNIRHRTNMVLDRCEDSMAAEILGGDVAKLLDTLALSSATQQE